MAALDVPCQLLAQLLLLLRLVVVVCCVPLGSGGSRMAVLLVL
jgi:hypothetical protein